MRHILIRIEDLETLTDRELEELVLFLRQILQHSPDLSPAEHAAVARLLAAAQSATRSVRQSRP